MKIEVKIDAVDASELVAAHLRDKFKSLAGAGEWLSVSRVGDLPKIVFTFELEAKPSGGSAWD